MWQNVLDSGLIPLLERSAAFTARRHELLAGNVANIDTPYYKPRDLDVGAFREAVRRALADRSARSEPASLAAGPANPALPDAVTPPARRLRDFFPDDLHKPIEVRRSLDFHDAADRQVETELMELTKNSLAQSLSVELLAAQFQMLQAAITERV